MNIHYALITLLLFSSCKQTSDVIKVASESKINPIADIDLEGFWMYRTADLFMDGGSIVMGFINSNGEVLYLWFDYSIASPQNYRRCFLKGTYNDKEAIEVLPNSELEQRVLALIENASCLPQLEDILPNREKAIEIIKTRNVDLRLVGPAKVTPN